MNYRLFRERLAKLEAKFPAVTPEPDGDPQCALVRRIQQDPDLRRAALRWFAAEARHEPQAAQLKDELARLICQLNQQ